MGLSDRGFFLSSYMTQAFIVLVLSPPLGLQRMNWGPLIVTPKKLKEADRDALFLISIRQQTVYF